LQAGRHASVATLSLKQTIWILVEWLRPSEGGKAPPEALERAGREAACIDRASFGPSMSSHVDSVEDPALGTMNASNRFHPSGTVGMSGNAHRSRRIATRHRIIRAAIEVAATHGLGEVSVARILYRAGVSRSTFYEHFVDRQACLLAAIEGLEGSLTERLEAVGVDGESRVVSLIDAIFENIAEDPLGMRMLFADSLAGGPHALDIRMRLQQRMAFLIGLPTPDQPGVIAPVLLDDLVGGLCRLLAMRLSRTAASSRLRLDPTEIAGWLDAYSDLPIALAGGLPSEVLGGNLGSIDAGDLQSTRGQSLPLTESEPNQRRRIFSATARLSYEMGFGAITVTDITTAAGVSRNTFYRHFHGKADAANGALELMLEQVIGSCAAAFTSASAWPERIWRAGAAFADLFSVASDYAHLGLVDTHVVGDEMAGLIYGRIQAFTLFLEEGYRSQSRAEPLPRVYSDAIAATMYEAAFQALRNREPGEWYHRALPRLVFVCLAPFIGYEAALNFVVARSSATG
jgi:AcrR family transcriptional regulator